MTEQWIYEAEQLAEKNGKFNDWIFLNDEYIIELYKEKTGKKVSNVFDINSKFLSDLYDEYIKENPEVGIYE